MKDLNFGFAFKLAMIYLFINLILDSFYKRNTTKCDFLRSFDKTEAY